ncbi:hypothetical protein Q3G72_023357 [Acer saccharum]|nr:hypothetical protein Q3G72_023357 [Acer saccharum]
MSISSHGSEVQATAARGWTAGWRIRVGLVWAPISLKTLTRTHPTASGRVAIARRQRQQRAERATDDVMSGWPMLGSLRGQRRLG